MPNGKLFYTGSNAGYGSAEVGRDPGIWDLSDNSFEKVPGLREPRETETSGSVLLPPAQDQRYMIAGGGGIGESHKSTDRTDVIDLEAARAALRARARPGRAGPLPEHGDHARRQGGDHRRLDRLPGRGRKRRADLPPLRPEDEPPHPGGRPERRARLPLLGAAAARRARDHPGQRPPLRGRRQHRSPAASRSGSRSTPRPTSTPTIARRSRAAPSWSATAPRRASTPRTPARSRSARLIRPSAVTHVTDVEQRSIALSFSRRDGGIEVTIPRSDGLVPSGWYMLFVDNGEGTPSEARWVRVR